MSPGLTTQQSRDALTPTGPAQSPRHAALAATVIAHAATDAPATSHPAAGRRLNALVRPRQRRRGTPFLASGPSRRHPTPLLRRRLLSSTRHAALLQSSRRPPLSPTQRTLTSAPPRSPDLACARLLLSTPPPTLMTSPLLSAPPRQVSHPLGRPRLPLRAAFTGPSPLHQRTPPPFLGASLRPLVQRPRRSPDLTWAPLLPSPPLPRRLAASHGHHHLQP